jgi:hypothetical protein
MVKKSKVEDTDVPDAADIARGDEVLKKMLQTKPKQHKDMVKKGRLTKRKGGTGADE